MFIIAKIARILIINSVDKSKLSYCAPTDEAPHFPWKRPLYYAFFLINKRFHLFCRLVTGERVVKNALTVTMVTHWFQAVDVNLVLVTTTSIHQMSATVTERLADV